MQLSLEIAVVTCTVIWGVVHLIRHFLPSYYESKESNWWDDVNKRVKKIEEQLNITTPKE